MLGQRLRRWTYNKTALVQRLVFLGRLYCLKVVPLAKWPPGQTHRICLSSEQIGEKMNQRGEVWDIGPRVQRRVVSIQESPQLVLIRVGVHCNE